MNEKRYKPLVILSFDNWSYCSTDEVKLSTCDYCKHGVVLEESTI